MSTPPVDVEIAAKVAHPGQEPIPAGPPPGLAGLGLRGVILSVQLFFLLLAASGSPVFGGGWTAYLVPFEIYVTIFFIAFVVEGVFAPIGAGARIRLSLPPEERPGALGDFAFAFGMIFFVAVGVGTAFLTYIHAPTIAISGQTKINLIVYTLVFVAPTEEFLFRNVLPRRLGWVLGSVVLFGAYHVGAYSAAAGTFNTTVLVQIGLAMAIGFLLWVVYYDFQAKRPRRGGIGLTVPLHGAYNLFVLGVLGGFHLIQYSIVPFVR